MKDGFNYIYACIFGRAIWPVHKQLLNAVLQIVFLWVSICCIPFSADANGGQKVLVLHSYHQGYLWTDMIQDGFSRSLSASFPKADLHIEYMNTKRQATNTLFPKLYDLYKTAYSNVKFDVIVASDNNALDFLILYRDRLFPGVPVVFCGINDIFKYRFDAHSGYTGVSEDLDIASTISIALKLHPGTKKIAVITDATETGLINLYLARKVAVKFPTIKFIELHKLTASQLNASLKQLEDDTIVLSLSFFRDPEGRTFSARESMDFIVSASPRPVYTVWDFYMAPGAIGGKLLSGRLQGENAAVLAGRIMRGEKPSAFPIVESPTEYVFDFAGLQKFNISESLLPAGSIVTGKPDTFYTRFGRYLWLGSIVFTIQIVVISLLLSNIVRRRREEIVRKGVEDSLRENNEMFSLFLQNSPVYIYIKEVTPTESRVVQASENFKELTGIPGSEMIGKTMSELFSTEFAATMTEMDWALVSKGVSVKVDEDFNGRSYTTVKFPLVRGDKTLLAGFSIDITERKKAEEALRESEYRWKFAIEGSGDGVWDWNIQTDEAKYSNRWKEMLGYADGDILPTNQEWVDRIHLDDQSYVAGSMQAYLEGKTAIYVVEYRLRCKDESYKWILGRGMVVSRSENGKPLRMIGTHTDITDRKKHAEEQLKIEKLESLGVLAGGIAHDFNNILTGIMGNISFSLMFIDPMHKSYKRLTEAEKASVRAGELAQQLLTFARGGEPLKKVASIQHLVNESVSLVLSGSNVRGIIDIPDSLHAIEADEGQISQVFNNLIINATQAMPGGGTLTVTARNKEINSVNTQALPTGMYVRISFADEGCGISADDMKKIFDPYFTTKSAGNGLGLASAHSICSRHGGNIGATSTVGKGTTFTIYLPSTGVICAEHQTETAKQNSRVHQGSPILVMDDEEMIRDLAAEMLEYLGCQVTTCADGAEALVLYKAAMESGTPFAAVIMDLTIPAGMGGKEASQQILAIDPAACLIVSSGYSNDPVMSDYKKYGFNAAVAKPYNMTEFSRLLSSLRST
ncbi:MAG: PAS domain-containing protein [Verrucomicrobia bacterium]|nr:PAS domain-containing protein [Deltaproteobacteria bacterium]